MIERLMAMKTIRILTFLILNAWIFNFASAAEPVITHVVTEDETAWFLASVYYGKGSDFPKLLKSNKLSRPEDMTEGMEIRIENPKFSKTSPGFSDRYDRLWEQRQKSLGLNSGQALPHVKVVIPSEKIRNRDHTPTLPFTEVREPAGQEKNPERGH